VRIDRANIFRCLSEIFSNAIEHGIHEYIGVQAKDREDTILLRFKNKVSPNTPIPPLESGQVASSPFRGLGLQDVHDVMSKEGISVSTVRTEKSFTVELHIPKSKFFRDVSLIPG
jgi:hypothetical protein